jgi:hypothetical protein
MNGRWRLILAKEGENCMQRFSAEWVAVDQEVRWLHETLGGKLAFELNNPGAVEPA